MDEIQNTILALKVILTIAPIAGYFLVLGVVNSQASPRLVSGRRDFLLLTGTFLPILFWPMAAVWNAFGWYTVVGLLLTCSVLIRSMLPHPWKQWVIYNANTSVASAALRRALDQLGWDYHQDGMAYTLPRHSMKIEVSGLGPLNATNLYIRTDIADPDQAEVTALVENVRRSLARYQLAADAGRPVSRPHRCRFDDRADVDDDPTHARHCRNHPTPLRGLSRPLSCGSISGLGCALPVDA